MSSWPPVGDLPRRLTTTNVLHPVYERQRIRQISLLCYALLDCVNDLHLKQWKFNDIDCQWPHSLIFDSGALATPAIYLLINFHINRSILPAPYIKLHCQNLKKETNQQYNSGGSSGGDQGTLSFRNNFRGLLACKGQHRTSCKQVSLDLKLPIFHF